RPGICERRREQHGREKTAARSDAAQPQLLPALRVAIDPKAQTRIRAGVKWRVVDPETLKRVLHVNRDGIGARVDRAGSGIVMDGPTPILPAVFKRVVVNDLIGAGDAAEADEKEKSRDP